MNKLTLENKRDFALTTDALDFMQKAYATFEKLGYLGGDNYIVSGCVQTGSSVTGGYMFLQGKLMPFIGGSVATNIQIVTETTTITVDNGTREQTTYRAEFGTSADPYSNVLWSSIARRNTIIGLKALINTNATAIDECNSAREELATSIDNIKIKIFEIGVWNMETAAFKNIVIDILYTDVLTVQAFIYDSALIYKRNINNGGTIRVVNGSAFPELPNNLAVLNLVRNDDAMVFNNANHSFPPIGSGNRGHIVVTYK